MADLLKIPASTLRYYDKLGLLPFVNRNAAGIRVFEQKDYEWLMIIERMKKTGMTLKEIRAYIDMAVEADSTIERRKQLFEEHRKETAEKNGGTAENDGSSGF